MSENSYQVGGDHYESLVVQPWEALQAWQTDEQFSGYLMGTAISSLARVNATAPGKGGRLDVEKAIHTLQKWLEVDEAHQHAEKFVSDGLAHIAEMADEPAVIDLTKLRADIESNETLKHLVELNWKFLKPTYLRTVAGGYKGTGMCEELLFLAQILDVKEEMK